MTRNPAFLLSPLLEPLLKSVIRCWLELQELSEGSAELNIPAHICEVNSMETSALCAHYQSDYTRFCCSNEATSPFQWLKRRKLSHIILFLTPDQADPWENHWSPRQREKRTGQSTCCPIRDPCWRWHNPAFTLGLLKMCHNQTWVPEKGGTIFHTPKWERNRCGGRVTWLTQWSFTTKTLGFGWEVRGDLLELTSKGSVWAIHKRWEGVSWMEMER